MNGGSRSVVTLSPSDMMSGSYASNSNTVTDSGAVSYDLGQLKYSSGAMATFAIDSDAYDMSFDISNMFGSPSIVSSDAISDWITNGLSSGGEWKSGDSMLWTSQDTVLHSPSSVEKLSETSGIGSLPTIETPISARKVTTISVTIVTSAIPSANYDSSTTHDLPSLSLVTISYSDVYSSMNRGGSSEMTKSNKTALQSNTYNEPVIIESSKGDQIASSNHLVYTSSTSGFNLTSLGDVSRYHVSDGSSNTMSPYKQTIYYSNSSLATVSTFSSPYVSLSTSLANSEASSSFIASTIINYVSSMTSTPVLSTTSIKEYTPSSIVKSKKSSTSGPIQKTSLSDITNKSLPLNRVQDSPHSTDQISTLFTVSEFEPITFSKKTASSVVTISSTEEFMMTSLVSQEIAISSNVILLRSSDAMSGDEYILKSTPILPGSILTTKSEQSTLLLPSTVSKQFTTSMIISGNTRLSTMHHITLSRTRNPSESSESNTAHCSSSRTELKPAQNDGKHSYDDISRNASTISSLMPSDIYPSERNDLTSSLSLDISTSDKKGTISVPTNSIKGSSPIITKSERASTTPTILSSETNSRTILHGSSYSQSTSEENSTLSTYHGSGSTFNINYTFTTFLLLLNFMI
ncbi:hypothetical protein, no similarity [Maudiozyma saulgeensis]|uniref:Uncharacterized protein n=1 Tax=Maudiozyma saulgeensis TaxID=1789683 RepID=A0A1X7R5S9_9SACH|nr:hypothetical protein, no similarity [Kazachstania saulgeensis]